MNAIIIRNIAKNQTITLSQIRYRHGLNLFNNVFISIASKLKEPTLIADFEILNKFVCEKVPNDIELKSH